MNILCKILRSYISNRLERKNLIRRKVYRLCDNLTDDILTDFELRIHNMYGISDEQARMLNESLRWACAYQLREYKKLIKETNI